MRTARKPSRTAIRWPSGLTARIPLPAIRWSSSPDAVSKTTVGPNPLAYSREPSGENFTAPYCQPARQARRGGRDRNRSRRDPGASGRSGPPRRLARGRRSRMTRTAVSPRALRTGIRRPSTRRLSRSRPAPRRSPRRSGPAPRDRAFPSAGHRSAASLQGSDVSLNATAPETGSTADVTTVLQNGEYSPSCDRSSRSNRRTSWSLSITDARVPSSASDMLTAATPSSGMRMMLVRRGAREKTRTRLTRVSESSQIWMASTASSSARSKSGSSSASPATRRASATVARSPARFAWNPAMRPAVDRDDRERGCAGRHPGQSAHHAALLAKLVLRGSESCGLIR